MLTPSLTGVLTVNPDFGTVERAVEGIDFFLQRTLRAGPAPVLHGGGKFLRGEHFGRPLLLFAARSGFDTGLNLYGKVAPKTSLGLLGAFDVGNRSDYIVRGRQEFNETDSLAISAIGRDDADGHNQVLVLHPVWRGGNWVCLTHWAPSFDNGRYLGDALNLDFSYEGRRVSFGNNFHYVRPGFRADNGYIPFTDLYGNYTWMTHSTEWREGPLRVVRLAGMMREEQHFDGRWFRLQPSFYVFSETRGDWGVNLHWEGRQVSGIRGQPVRSAIQRARVGQVPQLRPGPAIRPPGGGGLALSHAACHLALWRALHCRRGVVHPESPRRSPAAHRQRQLRPQQRQRASAGGSCNRTG